MRATLEWLATSGNAFHSSEGQFGLAHLRGYSAQFRVFGEGPPLVLVPGLAGGLELLGPLANELASHFRVITYQLRGEDDCFALRQRFDLGDLARDLIEFLDWNRLERPYLMGVSFGGALALEFAARYPHRLQGLIVQGTGARFEQSLLQRVAGMVLARYPLPSDNAFVNQFFNLLFGKAHNVASLFQFVTRQCWQTDQSVMAHRFQLIEHFDISNRLASIDAPTLLLTGDRDLLVSKPSLDLLKMGIPRVDSRSLPKEGHLAFITQPAHLASQVYRFTRELTATN